MRRLKRLPLKVDVHDYLNQRQKQANVKLTGSSLDTSSEWKGARQTQAMAEVVATLKRMSGERERCMYCLDSHGSDIEHFRPKAVYPKRMFRWRNLLLCCTECGRFKGNQFPLQGKRPLLIDPSKEEPWHYLDFDPDTGNLIARFDLQQNAFSPKGEKTVQILQLDRREVLAAGYLKTYRHICKKVQRFMDAPNLSVDKFISELREVDDHGLLGWFFMGTGQHDRLFLALQKQLPEVWSECKAAYCH